MKTFRDYLNECEQSGPEDIVFQWVNEIDNSISRRTCKEFLLDIKKFASYLCTCYQNPRNKHFAIVSENSYEYVVGIFGIIYAGGVVVPISNQCENEELKYEIDFSDSEMVFADQESKEKIEPLFSDIIVKNICDYIDYEGVEIEEDQTIDDLAALIFTSGTSGNSKCVMISLRNIFSGIAAYQRGYNIHVELDYVRASSTLLFLPMHHIMTFGQLFAWVLIRERIDICSNIKNFVRDMVIMRSDQLIAVPMVLNMLYHDIINNKTDNIKYVKILIVGGAPVNAKIIDVFDNAGILVTESYGLSEACGPLTYNIFTHSKKYNSVGKRLAELNEIRIIDNEICVKGDSIMPGYYKDDVTTLESIDSDGWLHTGDLAEMDDDGYYYLVGRKKNLIILSNGENVSPEELENKLLNNKDIVETIVKEKNDRIVAEIYCEPQKKSDIKKYVMELNKIIPTYKQISAVEFRDTPFERTLSGKIKR